MVSCHNKGLWNIAKIENVVGQKDVAPRKRAIQSGSTWPCIKKTSCAVG